LRDSHSVFVTNGAGEAFRAAFGHKISCMQGYAYAVVCSGMTGLAHALSATYKRDNKWERGIDRRARLGVLRPCTRRIFRNSVRHRPSNANDE
jgi:hypothetical protein